MSYCSPDDSLIFGSIGLAVGIALGILIGYGRGKR